LFNVVHASEPDILYLNWKFTAVGATADQDNTAPEREILLAERFTGVGQTELHGCVMKVINGDQALYVTAPEVAAQTVLTCHTYAVLQVRLPN
jgi:hypothetical protein